MGDVWAQALGWGSKPHLPSHQGNSSTGHLPAAAAPPEAEPENPGNVPLHQPPCSGDRTCGGRKQGDPKKCQQPGGIWIASPQALPAPHSLWSQYPCFEQTYHSSTELDDFQEHRENRRAQTSMLQADQRCCYLPSWRHRCASRYFTSEGWRWRRREASIGVWTRSSVLIRKYGPEEAAAGVFFSRACETGTENMVNTMLVKS